MSTFGNIALGLLGTALNSTLVNNTGAYYTGSTCNSIWTNGCDCDNTAANNAAATKAKTGLVAGGVLAGVVALTIGGVKLAQKAQEKGQIAEQIGTLNEEINAELAKVGTDATLDNYKTKIEENKKVLADADALCTKTENRKAEISSLESSLVTINKGVETETQNKANAQAIINDTNSTPEQKAAAQTALLAADAKLADWTAKQAKAENDKALLEQQQKKDLETLRDLQGKIEAMPNKGAGLDSIAATIEAKVAQLKELEAAYLEKADGNELNRTSEDGFAKLFDTEGNVTASDVKKRDIREAINQFKTATDKKAAAQNLKKLWDKAVETNDTDIINNQTLKQAYNIVMKQADLDE